MSSILTLPAEAKAEASESATRQANYLAQFPYLTPVPAGEYATAAHGSKNLKRELRRAFPGVPFSVTSDTFSGGDSIKVSWPLGPTKAEVKAISDRYQEGHFDGMADIYVYRTDDDNTSSVFGGAKYVMEQRHVSEADLLPIARALASLWRLPEASSDQDLLRQCRADEPSKCLRDHADDLLRVESLPAGALITGAERIEGKRRNAHGWACLYRVTFTAPTAAAAKATHPLPSGSQPLGDSNDSTHQNRNVRTQNTTMKVTLENGQLVIKIPVKEKPYQPSKSGKTLTVAGTEGFTKTELQIDGKPVTVNLHAYVKA